MREKKKGTGLRIGLGCVVLLGMLAAAFLWYTEDYYRADTPAVEALKGDETVAVTREETGYFFDGPGESSALIFYPGAKVDAPAYAPLMAELAREGTDCFLVEMPFHLAIFGVNKADKVMEGHHYDRWYIGGHSLGGAMAASYGSAHPDRLGGLVLLAAYPTAELGEELSVLSVYGSEDRVLNLDKVAQGRGYMPRDYTELCIDGGNHAWFGSYGEQKGDGQAAVSHEEQWEQTAQAVIAMVAGKELG